MLQLTHMYPTYNTKGNFLANQEKFFCWNEKLARHTICERMSCYSIGRVEHVRGGLQI